MLKNIFTITACLLVFTSMAQTPSKKGTLEQEKIGFFTRHIGLTTEEAKVFWPLYNDMEKEFHYLHDQEKKLTEGKKLDELSEEELNEILNDRLALKQKEVDVEKKYLAKFKEILSTKKVAKIYTTQEKWKKYLLKKISDKNSIPPRSRRR